MYCGVNCYRSPGHSQCSEAFYKDCIQSELADLSGANRDKLREKTSEILKKAKTDAETEDLLLDSDDDEDLSDRIANIDLEDSESLWAVLTPEERKDFKSKLNSGELLNLVPPNERNDQGMWWEVHLPQRKITDLSQGVVNETNQLHPCLPSLNEAGVSINTKESSALVKYNLINVLFAYTLTYRHLSWHITVSREILSEELHDFFISALNLSTNLSKDENFTSAEIAITSGISRASQNPSLNQDCVELARSDVANIIKGPGGGNEHDDLLYILAALSDLKSIASKVRDNYVKNESFNRKRCVLVSKKIDYFLCWVQQHPLLF